MNQVNLADMARQDSAPYGREWVERTRVEIGADLLGVVAIEQDSHPDLLYGVKTFLPSARACVIIGMEYDSETMNLIKHPVKYAGKVTTGELLAPHVNQLNKEIDQANYDLARLLKKSGYRSGGSSRNCRTRTRSTTAPLSSSMPIRAGTWVPGSCVPPVLPGAASGVATSSGLIMLSSWAFYRGVSWCGNWQ